MLWRLFLILIINVICGKCGCILFYFDTNPSTFEINDEEENIKISPRYFVTDTPNNNRKPLNTAQFENGRRKIFFPTDDRRIPNVHEYHPTIRTTTLPPFPVYTPKPMINRNSNQKFSAKLYHVLSTQFSNKNLVYSPISIQSLLAILYLGAEHETAKQLQTALELPESSSELLNQFQSIMEETQRLSTHFKLDFAQKIYFKNELVLRYNVRDTAKAYFYSEIAPISFDSPTSAAEEINHWVAKKTQNRIQDIVTSDTFDDDTQAVLVNAIYLKAKWAKEFSITDTLKQEFHIGNQAQSILVDMMYIEDDLKYGEFPELDAQIVELPFLDSELSMLIILPNQIDGLASVESHLEKINLNQLLSKMKTSAITVRMPKFKIETDLDMEDPLKKLGIRDIFTNDAQLGNLFSNPNTKVSKVQHKAFIDVNEGGVEAAASTFIQIVPLSLEPNMVYFTANHPFMFAIRSPQAVYFIGHVINNFQ